jgi:hypothetical protein
MSVLSGAKYLLGVLSILNDLVVYINNTLFGLVSTFFNSTTPSPFLWIGDSGWGEFNVVK